MIEHRIKNKTDVDEPVITWRLELSGDKVKLVGDDGDTIKNLLDIDPKGRLFMYSSAYLEGLQTDTKGRIVIREDY